jgi:hypothetical protein
MIRITAVSRNVRMFSFILLMLSAVLSFPYGVRAECEEYRIIEYEDRVEAVCVGEHLTEAEKKTRMEEQKRQELEEKRSRDDQLRLLKTITEQKKVEEEAETRNKQKQQNPEPVVQQQPDNKKPIRRQKP